MKYTIEDTTLTNIANSIRNKTNTTETIVPESMAGLIDGIEVGGSIETCNVTVSGINVRMICGYTVSDGNLQPTSFLYNGNGCYICAKNSLFIIVMTSVKYSLTASGECNLIEDYGGTYVYNINGDCTFTIS